MGSSRILGHACEGNISCSLSYICADMEECPQPPRSSVPSCLACSLRVNAATDALAWEDVITQWVAGLQNEFCTSFEDPEQCQTGVAFVIPLALPLLVEQP